ncbi:MAG: MBL fold metallo-hydrolase [Leptospiraceae bacterium]|nr:MBL fold metallo-hydrolase [Leptospiraceae bacterium]
MSVITIDCNYVKEELASAFLMIEGEEALFVENNTSQAVPFLLKSLDNNNIKKENVKYLIITHVHLDHAGGTSALLKHLPNAIVLAHPKAAPHLINPERLVESAKKVYGAENFQKLYGEIEPVPKEKVRIMQDWEKIQFGSRFLKFIFTRGHANHHFVIHDSKTNGVFTGDSFGIGYPAIQKGKKPFIFPSTTPTDFDPVEARLSIEKILQTGAEKVYLTHFGEWHYMKEGADQLIDGLNEFEKLLTKVSDINFPEEQIDSYCVDNVYNYFMKEAASRDLQGEGLEFLKFDAEINAMGISFAAKRARKKIK